MTRRPYLWSWVGKGSKSDTVTSVLKLKVNHPHSVVSVVLTWLGFHTKIHRTPQIVLHLGLTEPIFNACGQKGAFIMRKCCWRKKWKDTQWCVSLLPNDNPVHSLTRRFPMGNMVDEWSLLLSYEVWRSNVNFVSVCMVSPALFQHASWVLLRLLRNGPLVGKSFCMSVCSFSVLWLAVHPVFHRSQLGTVLQHFNLFYFYFHKCVFTGLPWDLGCPILCHIMWECVLEWQNVLESLRTHL